MENSSINVNFEPVENEKDQEAVIEAVLFTIGGAVELRQLAAAIGQDKETAKRAVEPGWQSVTGKKQGEWRLNS